MRFGEPKNYMVKNVLNERICLDFDTLVKNNYLPKRTVAYHTFSDTFKKT